ncbi:MAG: EscU/YscU/HrcU family type III secretion system export apparatus switch protein [Alphaproteobacteria bacterium]|nr:EscU/YscU/HrcU family type III secretion system export apparatus switch protein [Alphaproteobacteria bacterium]
MSIKKSKKPLHVVALSYEQGKDHAPRIIAKGQGELAEKILSIAKEHRIPVHHDTSLAEILSAFELDAFIPLEAYHAVAQILSYIYRNHPPVSIAL